VLIMTRNAGRGDPVSGKLRRPLKGQLKRGADALQVAPHITASDRIQIEGGIMTALALKNRPEQKRPPRDSNAKLLGKPPNSEGRGIRIGAGEFKPKFNATHMTLSGIVNLFALMIAAVRTS